MNVDLTHKNKTMHFLTTLIMWERVMPEWINLIVIGNLNSSNFSPQYSGEFLDLCSKHNSQFILKQQCCDDIKKIFMERLSLICDSPYDDDTELHTTWADRMAKGNFGWAESVIADNELV